MSKGVVPSVPTPGPPGPGGAALGQASERRGSCGPCDRGLERPHQGRIWGRMWSWGSASLPTKSLLSGAAVAWIRKRCPSLNGREEARGLVWGLLCPCSHSGWHCRGAGWTGAPATRAELWDRGGAAWHQPHTSLTPPRSEARTQNLCPPSLWDQLMAHKNGNLISMIRSAGKVTSTTRKLHFFVGFQWLQDRAGDTPTGHPGKP